MTLDETGGLVSIAGPDISSYCIHGAQTNGCCAELKQPDGLYQCCTHWQRCHIKWTPGVFVMMSTYRVVPPSSLSLSMLLWSFLIILLYFSHTEDLHCCLWSSAHQTANQCDLSSVPLSIIESRSAVCTEYFKTSLSWILYILIKSINICKMLYSFRNY